MSLLTRPRHTVTVQLRESVQDDEGIENLAPVGDPIPVRCNVKPISTVEAEAYGITARETYRITARDWPGDHLSLVAYDGRDWDQHGEPQRHRMSPRTAHDVVIITANHPRGS
ncbi:hypothetical protein E7Z53_08095 [Kocuria salina]|uniref:hypothetical protein n=1 Tax=Kocuria salina TaxID=1929416 RepID=UPI001593660F|nr:hypothetical protein [Kocuria salina]NVC23402.1 hypothetical protein [Kocuria salina]